ncbi:hypothetical protein OTU49_007744, partial [Cherax quadricarinatus]
GEVNRSDGPVAGSQDNYQPRNVRLTDETFAGRQQDDPELIQYICYHLHRPSSLPYNLSKPQVNDHSQYGQSLHLMNNILHGMVLKTIPWERIKFRVMCIENNHIPEGKKTLRKFMVSKGYKFLGERKIDSWFGWPELLVYKKNGS